MIRFRHSRRLRSLLPVVMIVAMLWSQLVMAGHGLCSMAPAALADIASAAEQGCHQSPATHDATVCSAHCIQGDQSNEVARVPPVPALAPALSDGFPAIAILEAEHVSPLELPPPVSWHRPTAHPASLLLI